MAGTTMARRQDPMAAAVEFGDQLVDVWHALGSATWSLVGATNAQLLGLAQNSVAILEPRVAEAKAWLSDLHRVALRALDDSVTGGLKKLGIPTHADYVALTKRLDRVSASVRRLEAGAVRKVSRGQAAKRPAR